jgi:hypothetical protein
MTEGTFAGIPAKVQSKHAAPPESLRGKLFTTGIGREIILRFLNQKRDIPGINRNVVDDQLANLKASGDYQRIILRLAWPPLTAIYALILHRSIPARDSSW